MTKKQIPEEFKKIIFEFVADISNTFPEYKSTLTLFLDSNGINIVNAEESETQKVVNILYEYCSKVYPERFFDILYKNEKLFNKKEYNVNTHFLPNIDFSVLWNTEGISDATRETIWKYLQLILMTIITNIDDRKSFGDAANLFEAINEDELRNKLEETIQQMYNMFEGVNTNASASAAPTNGNGTPDVDANNTNESTNESDGFNFLDWAKTMGKNAANSTSEKGKETDSEPNANANAESIHDHISQILNGKIGKLAKEIAEETAKDVDFDMDFNGENGENVDFNNVFQKMFKNPGKLMSLVKNVGSKLDEKFKSGEIKESELMQEASDLLSKMKNMPGMGNLTDMLNKMGMGGMMGGMGGGGGNSKVNIGAMQSHLQKNMKLSKMKERMQQKLQQQRAAAQAAAAQAQAAAAPPPPPPKKTSQVFSTGEVVDKTDRNAGPVPGSGCTVDSSFAPAASISSKKNKKK
jgi:GTP cyclohydrolase I